MRCSIKSRSFCIGPILALFVFLSVVNAPALSTGIPLQFSIDPATIQQKEKDKSILLATVVLKAPSPTVFVCRLRSSDEGKVSFNNIVFRKGQLKGTGTGSVYWPRVLSDCDIKVSAFSVDAPGEKIWFTITLKPADDNG